MCRCITIYVFRDRGGDNQGPPEEDMAAVDKYNVNHEPAGSPQGGEFASGGGGSSGGSPSDVSVTPSKVTLSYAPIVASWQGDFKDEAEARLAEEGQLVQELTSAKNTDDIGVVMAKHTDGTGREVGVQYDAKTGEVLWVAVGNEASCSAAPATPGTVMVHTHPSADSLSFSRDDLAVAVKYGYDDMRVVGVRSDGDIIMTSVSGLRGKQSEMEGAYYRQDELVRKTDAKMVMDMSAAKQIPYDVWAKTGFADYARAAHDSQRTAFREAGFKYEIRKIGHTNPPRRQWPKQG